MKAKQNDIIVGVYYELPDGRIAYTYGVNGPRKCVSYYFDDDNGSHTVSFDEIRTWKRRTDLRDFPNARDPRLPCTFDLFWDIKYLSDLREAISNNHDELDSIRQAMAEHNIAV